MPTARLAVNASTLHLFLPAPADRVRSVEQYHHEAVIASGPSATSMPAPLLASSVLPGVGRSAPDRLGSRPSPSPLKPRLAAIS